MKYLKITAITALIALFFVSCSDDDNNNPVNNDPDKMFFEFNENSYWIMDTYDEDDNGIKESSYMQDSVVFEQKETFNGNDATVLTAYNDNGTRKKYYYEDDNYIYARSINLLPTTLDLADIIDEFPDDWVNLYDKNKNNWEVLNKLELGDVELLGYTVKDVAVVMNGEKSGTESIKIDGTNYTCDVVTLSTGITGKVNILVDVPVNISVETKYYFSRGYGLLKVHTPPFSTGIEDLGNFDGYQATAVRMNMK